MLELVEHDRLLTGYPISSSPQGVGFLEGSMQTPTGKFAVVEKIGHGLPAATVYQSRIPTALPCDQSSPEDQVASRIIRLHGLESANRNTLARYIYIHGTNQPHLLGSPAGHGCIRMHPDDILEIFPKVCIGTPVTIQ